MNSEKEIEKEYINIKKSYERLGKNLVDAIKSFLHENDIPYLEVYSRVKDFNSFYEKIGRKNYENPFDQIEDICGVRVICYYLKDIERIQQIIKKEFLILDSENKSESLGLKEFAYRSFHNIIRIKDNWCETPNYRGLNPLKAEIQTRTILMHAWAEIEHKLNYKSDAQVPKDFQRKLFRLSAKFEEADEQFEELKTGISDYRKQISKKSQSTRKFNLKQDFNIDSYSAYLNFHFPTCDFDKKRVNRSFEEMIKRNFSFKDIEIIIEKLKPHVEEISDDLNKAGYQNIIKEMPTEIIGFGLHVFGIESYKGTFSAWKENVDKWKTKITTANTV